MPISSKSNESNHWIKLLFKRMHHVISSLYCYETVSSFQSLNDQQKELFVSIFCVLYVVVYALLAHLHRNVEIIFWNSYIDCSICGIEWISFFTNCLLYTELLNEYFYFPKPKNRMNGPNRRFSPTYTNDLLFLFTLSISRRQ